MHHRTFRATCPRFAPASPAPGIEPAPHLPTAELDRFDDPSVALALIDALTSHPPKPETIAILLDREHRGSTIMNFDRTVDTDSILRVADAVTERAICVEEVGAVVLASIRPGGSDELDDIERWLTIDEQLGMFGIELVEWFVIGRSVSCPRALFGDAPRWIA